jgi:hypothetical protein
MRPEELLLAIIQQLSGAQMPLPVQPPQPVVPPRGGAAEQPTPFPRIPMQVALLRQLARPLQARPQRPYTRMGGGFRAPTSFPVYE